MALGIGFKCGKIRDRDRVDVWVGIEGWLGRAWSRAPHAPASNRGSIDSHGFRPDEVAHP
jgi:hypothetical protein